MPRHNKKPHPAFLLKGAAGLALAIGLALLVWLVDKAVRYPNIHARQLEAEAPLWLPMMLFVAVCTAAAGFLFWTAARRVERGEDLFARRHRRSKPRL